jgi:hypothetical protein
MSTAEVLFISVFNMGCIEIAENHLQSLLKNGITNYMAYVTDNESLDYLTNKGYQVSAIPLAIPLEVGVVGAEPLDFGTEKFNTISYLRYYIINKLLSEGRNVWYLDVDTVVLYNLNLLVPQLLAQKFDLSMQNDMNMPCTGCMLFAANDKTKQLTETIYKNRTSRENDQIIMFTFLRQNRFKLKLHLLNPGHFPNGLLYFSELHTDPRYESLHRQFKNSKLPVYFVHANWMVGVDTKIKALKSKNLWLGETPTPPGGHPHTPPSGENCL